MQQAFTSQGWMAECVAIRRMSYGPRIFSSMPFTRWAAAKKVPGAIESLIVKIAQLDEKGRETGELPRSGSWMPGEFKEDRHKERLRFWYGCMTDDRRLWYFMGVWSRKDRTWELHRIERPKEKFCKD